MPKLKNGFYFINLNGSSHWTCLLKDKKNFYYFDSFGSPPPEEVEAIISPDYVYNASDLQNIKATSCGFFCVAFAIAMKGKGNKESLFKDFLNRFSKNSKQNEKVLHDLLK